MSNNKSKQNKSSVKSSNDNYSLNMLQNNISGGANNTTILHKYGHILFAVFSRHQPIKLSVPPTFQGNLIKQRIIQQSSRIITCRVAHQHLSLFWRHNKLKKTEKNHHFFYFINKSSVNLLTRQNKLYNVSPARKQQRINVPYLLCSYQHKSNVATIIQIRLLLLPLRWQQSCIILISLSN